MSQEKIMNRSKWLWQHERELHHGDCINSSKRGQVKDQDINGRSSLKWDVKSKHHGWMMRHFSQVSASLGEFGTSAMPTLMIQKGGTDGLALAWWHTEWLRYNPTDHLWGVRIIGWDICEHMNYRVFHSTFSSTETFGCSTVPAAYTSLKEKLHE